MHIRAIILSVLFFVCLTCKAQIPFCVDSNRVNPTFQCNMQNYNPVCGCNNITYRNECNALNNHGVLNWRSGVCSGLNVDFYPNPIGPATTFTVNLSYPEFISGNSDIKIMDVFGKTWEHRIVNNFNRMTIQFDVATLKTGVYLLVVTSSLGSFTIQKFAKY